MNAVALLCDLRGSRELDDRQRFGKRLHVTAKEINENFRPNLLTKFDIQRGIDEFGVVLKPGRVGEVLIALWERLQVAPVRFALASGTIDVMLHASPETELAPLSNADGTALHRATQLLDELHDSESLFGIKFPNDPGTTERLLSSFAEMTYLRLLSWTERQTEVFFTYRQAGLQSTVAEQLGIQQGTVSRTLSKVEYRPTLSALDLLVETLDQLTLEAAE